MHEEEDHNDDENPSARTMHSRFLGSLADRSILRGSTLACQLCVEYVVRRAPRVSQIFDGIAKKMLLDFDQIHAQITHAGERGGQWEKTLSAFLVKYLPKKYAIGTGQIMDRTGVVSPQCDIVIYDAFNCPLILSGDDLQIFPIEAVFMIIEVKSIINAHEIEDTVLKAQKIKRMSSDQSVYCVLFACRSNYKTEPKIETSANAWASKSRNIPYSEELNLVCVLEDGLFICSSNEEEGYSRADLYWNIMPTTLLWFLSLILQELDTRKSSVEPFTLISYASKGEIGPVKALRFDR